MTSEEIANEVSVAIRTIVMKNMGKDVTEETADVVKTQITEYLIDISETMGYPNLPKVQTEYDGMFLSVNFLDEKEQRLETLGDLVYYMDTGETIRRN